MKLTQLCVQLEDGFAEKMNHPDIQISATRTLYGCSGPAEFIREVERAYRPYVVVPRGWAGVRLINGLGTDLGTLYEVRQVYHVWMEEEQAWKERNGMAPARRPGISQRPYT